MARYIEIEALGYQANKHTAFQLMLNTIIKKYETDGKWITINKSGKTFRSRIEIDTVDKYIKALRYVMFLLFENNFNLTVPYFNNIQSILSHIDKENYLTEEEKNYYLNIFLGQLTSHELYLILYFAMLPGKDQLLEQVRKYNIFESLYREPKLDSFDFQAFDYLCSKT